MHPGSWPPPIPGPLPLGRPLPHRRATRLAAIRPALIAATAGALLASGLAVPRPAAAQPAPARPADVETLDGIMAAVYDAISGPAGEARDWDRFRSLFIEGARLIPTGPASDGGWGHRVMTPEDFAMQSGPGMEERGFFENEIHRTVERYGPVVHAFSTYESRRLADDPEPFARGINSFQLLHDGSRWWVVTIYWHGETPTTPIPTRYLGEGG